MPLAGGEMTAPDHVEVHLYTRQAPSDVNVHVGELLGWLHLLQEHVEQVIQPGTSTAFMWQKEALRFKLYLPEAGKKTKKTNDENFSQEPHIYARCNFGDNIEDEWLIVWLLMQASRKYPELLVRYVFP